MKANKKFILFMIIAMLIVLSSYGILVHSGVLSLALITAIVIILGVGFIYLIGMLIMSIGLTKNPEQFVLYFMSTTTIQMLSALAVAIAIIYSKIQEPKAALFHLMGLFVILLAVQSVLLIRFKP